MRLLTHNQLICVRRSCTNNYPLDVEAKSLEREATDFNPDFIFHLLPTIDYSVLHKTAVKLGISSTLPPELPQLHDMKLEDNKGKYDELLKLLHTILIDTHVTEGVLKCNGCERNYPIQQGIPNMRLREEEM